MNKYFSIITLGVILLFGGCNIINPTEPTPTYVHIDSFSVSSNYSLYGSNSSAINTVFAVYNGINIGVFQLPCNIPVLASAGNQLILSPGIPVNGFNDQESTYPFYTSFIDTLVPQPGKVITLNPKVSYNSAAKMIFSEPFENESIGQFVKYASANTDYDTGMAITTDPNMVFEGKGSGIIYFTKYDSTEVVGFNRINIASSTPVLCELNYKSNIAIAVGLLAVTDSATTTATTSPQYNNLAFGASPQKWQKVYINLAELVSIYPAQYYYLVIKAAVPYGQNGGWALFDNIKVITSQ